MRRGNTQGRHTDSGQRGGFSLLEVILAIAVLFASGVALAQLASLGRRHADRADRMTRAQMLCQNKLNEIIAGLTPLSSVADAPFLESPGWVYSVDVQPASWSGLVAVKISVAELPTADASQAQTVSTDALVISHKPRFSLVRWLRTATATGDGISNEGVSGEGVSKPFKILGDAAYAGGKP